MDIRLFISQLASVPSSPVVANPYHADDRGSANRRHNLALYLERILARRPRLLLLGEAPGYRGCRVTGVPFTSESMLLAEEAPYGLFGEANGFRSAGAGCPPREATATVVWNTLVELDVLPLLWNASPFHPHHPDRPDSNRAPTTGELALGRPAAEALLELFAIDEVIAVGNTAALALARWGIPAKKVRHPGHGGRLAFQRGLQEILGRI